MTLSEIEELLFLDVHDALGNVEGAKCHPKLLPREAGDLWVVKPSNSATKPCGHHEVGEWRIEPSNVAHIE
jgi:hypothetical protein